MNIIYNSICYKYRTKKSEIEMATCTDVKQKWGKLKPDAKSMYLPQPLDLLCHGKQRENRYSDLDPENYKQAIQILESGNSS